MINVRRSAERHHIGNKDQKSWMTFDPDIKADPMRNGFGVLNVLNEEILSPGSGFTLRISKVMVVITYVREGMIIYKGPLDKPDFIETKEFHRGSGVPGMKQYAFNVSQSEDAHIFQCGFSLGECDVEGGAAVPAEDPPPLEGFKKLYTHSERQGVLRLIASPDGRDSSIPIRNDVEMYSTYIHNGNHIIHELAPGRSAWLHVVKGHILLDGLDLQTGDGAGFSGVRSVSFTAKTPTEVLLFDLCAQLARTEKTAPQSEPLAV